MNKIKKLFGYAILATLVTRMGSLDAHVSRIPACNRGASVKTTKRLFTAIALAWGWRECS